MGFDSSLYNKGIVLELGLNSSSSSSSMVDNNNNNNSIKIKPPAPSSSLSFDPSLTLALFGDHDQDHGLYRQDSVSGGGSSLISGASVSVCVKREREVKSEESADERRVINNSTTSDQIINNEEDEDEDDNSTTVNNGSRKKLRLTKAQSALLEEAFKHHSTLNPKQKQELARDLKLRPRQVEVWFQNRRARTKLKQTEVDCEYLKKCCEALKEENTRLHKELQALKQQSAQQQQPPLYMQLPAATLSMCPSCERIGDTTSAAAAAKTIPPFTKPHFFNPFNNPSSAAC